MSNQADIRDIQVLGDLKNAFGRFGEDVSQVLPALERQLEEIREQLEERLDHWRRRADEAEDQVHAARRALRDCEDSGSDEDEGDAPDCSWAEEVVSDAEKHLAECEKNLETVKQWRHRIESQIADFQNDIHRLSNLASSRSNSAQAFLSAKLQALNQYIGIMPSSGSGGYATTIASLPANTESDVSGQKKVTELPAELIAELKSDTLPSSVYPNVLDPRTGQHIPFPTEKLKFIRRSDIRPRNANLRNEFINEWYKRGFETPKGGWGCYDIHHIHPIEFNGTDDFWNLVPVERKTHQDLFNPFWDEYGYWMEKLI